MSRTRQRGTHKKKTFFEQKIFESREIQGAMQVSNLVVHEEAGVFDLREANKS